LSEKWGGYDHFILELQRHAVVLEQLGREEQGQPVCPLEPEVPAGDESRRRRQQLVGVIPGVTGRGQLLFGLGHRVLEADRVFLRLFAAGPVRR